jgi:Predicted sugar kinase
MTKPFQRVLLVSKYRDPSVLPGLRLLRDFIQSQGREVFIETQCSGEINDTLGLKLMAFSEARAETDLVIAIGGDGTLLGTARNTASSGIAILGINQGRLGFLADLSIDQIESALPPILQGIISRINAGSCMPNCGATINKCTAVWPSTKCLFIKAAAKA